MQRAERRKYKRVRGEFHVSFSIDINVVIPFSCSARDISEGGMKLVITRKAIPGHIVTVAFSLPGSEEKLSLAAEIIWVIPAPEIDNKYLSGVRFVALSQRQKDIIHEYVGNAMETKHEKRHNTDHDKAKGQDSDHR